mmetsp:Transcript_53616/g.121944  ORF Transcript_53616/g.121944 Transcript_53616/m.121944 type:complete len:202 (+) Transcript_53616:1040-1645(+)
MEEFVHSKADRCIMMVLSEVVERYEKIFGEHLWPQLRRARVKAWKALKQRWDKDVVAKNEALAFLRVDFTEAVGEDAREVSKKIERIGRLICGRACYGPFRVNHLLRRWEKAMYCSVAAVLKTEGIRRLIDSPDFGNTLTRAATNAIHKAWEPLFDMSKLSAVDEFDVALTRILKGAIFASDVVDPPQPAVFRRPTRTRGE